MPVTLFAALAAVFGLAIAAMVRYARWRRWTGLRVGAGVLALAVTGVCWFLHDSGGITAGVVFVVVFVGVQLLPDRVGEGRSDSSQSSR